MSRLKCMAMIGAVTVAFGAILRAGADSWSRDIVSHPTPGVTITKHFDSGRYELLHETGAWSIGFGLVVLALVLSQWASREPAGPPLAASDAQGGAREREEGAVTHRWSRPIAICVIVLLLILLALCAGWRMPTLVPTESPG